MPQPKLTFAVSHYDRYVPFFDGSVVAEGFDLDVRHVGQGEDGPFGRDRHARALRGEFDIAELSLSSYLMARARELPFTAIPVFPRRLFSQSQMWINSDRGVREPKDLIGKKVGLNTFQTTLSVLAKGDLQAEYEVPWRKIEWIVSADEIVPFTPEPGVVIRSSNGADLGQLLLQGEIDAIFSPHPPRPALEGAANIRRLFSEPKQEEANYFKKHGYFPIMHVIAFREEVLAEHPQAASALLDALRRANEISDRFYSDPNWSRLAWGRLDLEEERRRLGPDLWPVGFAKNRINLARFVEYSRDQGLITGPLPVESLFVRSTLDS